MTLEKLLSQIGTGTKQISDRYSDYAGTIQDHDHQVVYAYEPSAPPHGHIATSKHNYGGGHKSNASMSALTLLAFLFFLHILQQCIRDHMMEMSTTQPVVVMTAGREGEETLPKLVTNKIDKTGVTKTDDKLNKNDRIDSSKQNKVTDKQNYDDYFDSNNKKQLMKVQTTAHDTRSDDQKYKYVTKNKANRSSYFSGFVSAMDED